MGLSAPKHFRAWRRRATRHRALLVSTFQRYPDPASELPHIPVSNCTWACETETESGSLVEAKPGPGKAVHDHDQVQRIHTVRSASAQWRGSAN